MKKTAKIISLFARRGTGTEPLRLRHGGDNSNNGGNDKPDSTPTPEYVYASSFSKLNNGDGHTYLNPFLFTETGFYTVENEKVGEMGTTLPPSTRVSTTYTRPVCTSTAMTEPAPSLKTTPPVKLGGSRPDLYQRPFPALPHG